MPRIQQDDAIDEARRLAAAQDGVVSRRQLYAVGVTRWQVVANVRAGRWRRVGDQSVCFHTGPLSLRAEHWAAVFQGGPRAQLDGASALVESGLERFTVDRVRVSVPRGAKIRRSKRINIRQTRRWSATDLVITGVPRTPPHVAAVRASLWAKSDRQAALVMTMAVQQGITSAEAIGTELLRVRRDRRRLLLHALVNELLDGVRSLGELDIGRELERRGLPKPSRQEVRRDRRGRYYLDLSWPDWRLVVEIDGIHHAWAENVVGDALRHNAIALQGDTVLRIPLLGLRLEPDEFFRQIREALESAGWPGDVIRTVA